MIMWMARRREGGRGGQGCSEYKSKQFPCNKQCSNSCGNAQGNVKEEGEYAYEGNPLGGCTLRRHTHSVCYVSSTCCYCCMGTGATVLCSRPWAGGTGSNSICRVHGHEDRQNFSPPRKMGISVGMRRDNLPPLCTATVHGDANDTGLWSGKCVERTIARRWRWWYGAWHASIISVVDLWPSRIC